MREDDYDEDDDDDDTVEDEHDSKHNDVSKETGWGWRNDCRGDYGLIYGNRAEIMGTVRPDDA